MNIAKYIDHTVLKADTKPDTVKRYCREAKENGFASVCVNSCYAELVHKELEGTDVKTCCVVGFPLGAMSTKAKAYEAKVAVEDGADEIDMVINIGKFLNGDYDYVVKDISAVVEASKPAIVKLIIETCMLSKDDIVKACELALEAKAAFVKTSTGFSTAGASVEDISLMKKTVGDKAQVKASGGIRTAEEANAMLKAGADRIGAGNGVVLLK